MEHCWLWELDSRNPSGVNLFLHSEKAYLRYDEEKRSIILTLVQGIGEKYGRQGNLTTTQPLIFNNTAIELSLSNLLGDHMFHKRLGYMNLKELLAEKNKAGNQLSHKVAALFEIQKNAVMSFAVLSLIFIAIPLGIKVGRAETSANIVLAVALALGYYFIVMAIGWLETKPQVRPDLLVWLPNFLFQILGFYLFKRVSRY